MFKHTDSVVSQQKGSDLYQFGDSLFSSFPSHLRVLFKLCSFLLHCIHYSDNLSYWQRELKLLQNMNSTRFLLIRTQYTKAETFNYWHTLVCTLQAGDFAHDWKSSFSLISDIGIIYWFLESIVYIYSSTEHRKIISIPCTFYIALVYLSKAVNIKPACIVLRGSCTILQRTIYLPTLVLCLWIFLLKFQESLVYNQPCRSAGLG